MGAAKSTRRGKGPASAPPGAAPAAAQPPAEPAGFASRIEAVLLDAELVPYVAESLHNCDAAALSRLCHLTHEAVRPQLERRYERALGALCEKVGIVRHTLSTTASVRWRGCGLTDADVQLLLESLRRRRASLELLLLWENDQLTVESVRRITEAVDARELRTKALSLVENGGHAAGGGREDACVAAAYRALEHVCVRRRVALTRTREMHEQWAEEQSGSAPPPVVVW